MKAFAKLASAAVILAAGFASEGQAQHELHVPEGGFAVSDDLSVLPEAVRDQREALLAAAQTGNIGELGKILAAQPVPPTVSFGDPEDPIAFLKTESADGEGVEILAILADVLSAPYAAMDSGDGDPVYIWPYLAALPDLTELTPEQVVDGYRIVGHDGFESDRQLGTWYFWRVYIGPQGDLQAFIAGD